MYERYIKRFLDLFIASLAIILSFPFIMISLIAILIFDRHFPIFFQNRPGKGGKIFRLVKLKTMRDAHSATGFPLPDDQRLTAAGKIIRSLSIDELPQLFNVLSGDMSLVGPRPLLEEYLPLYSRFQRRRHEVKPGITGWAQVNGRNALTWERKFSLDVWYVDNLSLELDIKILFLTAIRTFQRRDISSQKSITMEKFTGNEQDHE